MEYRLGKAEDLAHIETFVWQAIFPAFDHPDLNEEQRASNDRVVEDAREVAMRAIVREDRVLYVAVEESRNQLAGMVIGERRPTAYPAIEYLIVARKYWGGGVAANLLEAVTFWLGNQRPLQLAVRHYNSRAIAFFAKHGFEDSGESAGDYVIPHILMIRPADYEAGPAEVQTTQNIQEEELIAAAENPAEIDFELDVNPPLTEATEEPLELKDLFAEIAEESTADNDIAVEENNTEPVKEDQATESITSRFPHIELEIALPTAETERENPYADRSDELDNRLVPEAVADQDLPFEFAFSDAEEEPDLSPPIWEELVFEAAEPTTEEAACANCGTHLPEGARFCFNCGEAQVSKGADLQRNADETSSSQPPPLPVIEPETLDDATAATSILPEPVQSFGTDQEGIDWGGSLITDFRAFFRRKFAERITDYFGSRMVERYQQHRQASAFQDTVSTQLSALADWVRIQRQQAGWTIDQGQRRLVAATEALIEFYLVEDALELHGGIWSQRLLRHQAKDWSNVDLFALARDYLKFEEETDQFYTDFVQMPAKVLRNASRQYLHAARDERVLFVCDQSLLGNGKQGFAMTDVAIYWRPVLQSAYNLLYQDIEQLEIKSDHLLINGLYFDGGPTVNKKLALLLRRLKTLVATYAA